MTKEPRPLISVIIPCYNQGEYLVEAVESVLAQDYQPLQVIVVNDGSTDDTEQVAQGLCEKYPQIEYYAQRNTGVCRACNNALMRVKGEYVLRLDADDYLPVDYIEMLWKYLSEAPPTTAYAYCDATYVGARQGSQKAGPYSLARLVVENYIHVSSLVRTEAARNVGYFNENMRYGSEDWDLWVQFAEHGYEGVYCPETALFYRQKAEGGRNQMQEDKYKSMIRQVYQNHPGIYRRPVNRLRVFWWRVKRRVALYI